jgi:multidrug resistance protein
MFVHHSESSVATTVSAYLAAVGVGQLVWGPLSDRYGRMPVLGLTLFLYELLTLACALSPEINSLIVFRTFEGFVVGCTIIAVQAIISDIYAPEERGAAMGAFLAPMLVGPIIAPLVGGALSEAFGWRATFYLLLVMGALISLVCWYVVPETLHYVVATKNPTRYHSMGIHKPVLMSPLTALAFLGERDLLPHFCVMAATFAPMFTTLTILPGYLAQSPYNLSPSTVGVCYLPCGVAMLFAAMAGGATSDVAAKRFPRDLSGRLVYGMLGVAVCVPACVAFGFCLQYRAHLAAVLITQSVLCAGQAFYMPANLGFLSTAKPRAAAAVGAVAMLVVFVAAAVSISVSAVLADIIGVDVYFVILAGLAAVSGAWAGFGLHSKSQVQRGVSSTQLIGVNRSNSTFDPLPGDNTADNDAMKV